MCIDCDVRPADITFIRDGGNFTFVPRSERAFVFLARVFAQVRGDLLNQDATRIVNKARALGFMVEVR